MNVLRKTVQIVLAMSLSLVCCGSLAFGQQDGRQQLFLSLEESINLALQNNLDISIEQYNPEIQKEEITSAEAAFDTSSTADASYTFTESDSDNAPTGTSNLEMGVGKRFTTGASYSVGVSTSITTFDSVDDTYETGVALTFTQPTLKNFGTDVNTLSITIARKNRDISISQLRGTVIDVVTDVKTAYWDVVNALADLEAKDLSLQLANDLVKINEAQVNVGTLAPIEVLQARAQAAARQVQVTNAELAVLNAEDALKRLLNFSENDPVWSAAIVPTDSPSESAPTLSLDEAIQIAMENREELKQVQQSIELQQLSLEYSENQLKPQLDLTGSLGMSGEDATYGDSVSGLTGFDNVNVTVGASFGYPLGNRAAKSDFNQAKLELDQARLSQRNTEQVITVDVRVRHRGVITAYDLIGSTRIARELAEEQLDAEQKKFNEGLSTNFQVLQYQDELTTARTSESQAITAYNQALANLDQSIGMTLERHNIVIQE